MTTRLDTGRLKAIRDLLFQVTATIMIPLTVAGMGWYYTRWQQNLTDLKTMIDLVSDQNPERRKYGIAMFEYLLKNDKVPVEFVTAQLDYANSSSDQDLLPLMEAALIKAARANPRIEAVYTEALQRLPSRLFVNVVSDGQRSCARKIIDSLKDTDKATLTVPAVTKATWGGESHELRVLRDTDLERARLLAGLFGTVGFNVKVVDLSAAWDGAKDYRPNTFELWFGSGPLPSICHDVTGGSIFAPDTAAPATANSGG
jgi:hypothetical protein